MFQSCQKWRGKYNMKITKLEKSTPEHLRSVRESRCEEETLSTGTGPFPGSRRRCGRFALYEMDGKKYCKQHAGDVALSHVLRGQN